MASPSKMDPESPGESPNAESPKSEIEGTEATRPRKSKGKGSKLNTWDLPELLPGAQPSATGEQKLFFEKRSIKVFRQQEADRHQDDVEYGKEEELRLAQELERDTVILKEMFETVEEEIIREIYFSNERSVDLTISDLLRLAENDSDRLPPVPVPEPGSFPVLTNNDGWEVMPPQRFIVTEQDQCGELSGRADSYKDRLEKGSPTSRKPD